MGVIKSTALKGKKSQQKLRNRQKKFCFLYICSCSVIVDVSYASVIGDIVWTGDGLNPECISSTSLVSNGVFSSACIVLQFSLASITLGGVLEGTRGRDGVIFERGGRF